MARCGGRPYVESTPDAQVPAAVEREDQPMSSALSQETPVSSVLPNARARALASRLERGALALIDLAQGLSDSEWKTPLPHDELCRLFCSPVPAHMIFVSPGKIARSPNVFSGWLSKIGFQKVP